MIGKRSTGGFFFARRGFSVNYYRDIRLLILSSAIR